MWDRLPACRRDSAVASGYWIKKIGGKKMGGKNIRALAVAEVAETFEVWGRLAACHRSWKCCLRDL